MFVGGKDGGSDAMLVIFETRKDTGRCWLALKLSFKDIARLRACECVQLGMCMCSRLVSNHELLQGREKKFLSKRRTENADCGGGKGFPRHEA